MSLRRRFTRILSIPAVRMCRKEWGAQQPKRLNERPFEYAFLFEIMGQARPTSVLDVGTGTTCLPHLIRTCGPVVTAIDNVSDYWEKDVVNRHFHVIDDDILAPTIKGPFDLVSCISVLEHVLEPGIAVRNMIRLLSSSGSLVLSFPYNEDNYVSNAYDLPDSAYGQQAKYKTQIYSRKQLTDWVGLAGAEIVQQKYYQFWTGDYWTQGEILAKPREVNVIDQHHLTCLRLIARK